jgi:hypothetical protein
MVSWMVFLGGWAFGFCCAGLVAARLDAIRVEQIEELREQLAERDGAVDVTLRGYP